MIPQFISSVNIKNSDKNWAKLCVFRDNSDSATFSKKIPDTARKIVVFIHSNLAPSHLLSTGCNVSSIQHSRSSIFLNNLFHLVILFFISQRSLQLALNSSATVSPLLSVLTDPVFIIHPAFVTHAESRSHVSLTFLCDLYHACQRQHVTRWPASCSIAANLSTRLSPSSHIHEYRKSRENLPTRQSSPFRFLPTPPPCLSHFPV